MSIVVVDQGAELFWFVSNALLQDDIPLKHVKTIPLSEDLILKELPQIVVLNGDDSSIHADVFIAKMRNHVFARQTMFIVVTGDTSQEYKKALITAGAGQIFYRGSHQQPSPKFFRSVVKWFLDTKNPDPQIFDYKPVEFSEKADFTTYGRLGWITATKCLVEVNVDLQPGQSVDFNCILFDEIGIKDAKINCREKNTVGRYYQYANGLICDLVLNEKDTKKLEAWLANNHDISKPKSIKLLFFEPDAEEREKIKKMAKAEKRYCARGFSNIDNFIDDMNFQLPHLILVNRKLISKSKPKFEPLKNYLKNHSCFCITYDPENITLIEDFKKNYDYCLHSQANIDGSVLDSMVAKLEAKFFPETDEKAPPIVYFNKHSPYSKISLCSPCAIKQLGVSGMTVVLPFPLSPYCAFALSSGSFMAIKLQRIQYLRNFLGKKGTGTFSHQCVFVGQTLADREIVDEVVKKIAETGFEKWKNPPPPKPSP